jgi:hypothetical protein
VKLQLTAFEEMTGFGLDWTATLDGPESAGCHRALTVLTARLMRYTGSCGSGASSRSSSSCSSGGSGDVIREGVLTTLACADAYMLDPAADTASGVSRIAGGRAAA